MIANYKVNQNYRPAEKFFAEKIIELVFNKTIDSHRVKLNNPKWIVKEIVYVLQDWHAKKIKNFDRTIKPVIIEALRILQPDRTLLFTKVEKTYFLQLLNKSTDKDYLPLYHATNLVLEANKHYLERLFDLIDVEISRVSGLTINQSTISELNNLNSLVDYLGTELVNHGYSKGFLYLHTTWLFNDASTKDFADAFTAFKQLSTREQEEFVVVFRLKKLAGKTKIELNSKLELQDNEKETLTNINKKSADFFSKVGDYSYYLKICLQGWDYLSVIEEAKKELFALMDLLHLGFPDNPFDFYKKCLVVGSRRPELTNIQPVNYVTDGYYKNNQDLYDSLHDKITRISEKKAIQQETIQKIVSAFRHLRLGRDADELEQKFINYWIGLEYIFSNYDINENTINRLKEFFIHAHSIAYVRRNLTEFCQDIQRLKLDAKIPGYNLDLAFLKDVNTFDFILQNYCSDYPLLAYRADFYKRFISDSKTIRTVVEKHRCNLEWHLTRCYRIRNEIVHDAAIHLNIESITGNLKYYLTFILNGLVSYLDDAPVDINMNGFISIEDYFILQEIRYNSLQHSGLKFEELIEEKSATEIFG